MYVYIRTGRDEQNQQGFTVGFYDPKGIWVPESDHPSIEEAAERVHYLQGGSSRMPRGTIRDLASRIRSKTVVNADSQKTIWTVTDVAAYLKTSNSWVYRAAASGQLPSMKIGGLVRFLPGQIQALGGPFKPLVPGD